MNDFYGAISTGGQAAGDLFKLLSAPIDKKLFAGRKTANPKKQAFFNGIEPRTFSFNYTFAPQSEAEANTIQSIIKQFTVNSLPSTDGVNDILFNFPAEYLISFENVKGFPIISSCVCTGVATNYSPSTMQLLKSGHTVQIGLSLSFTETDVRTSEDPGV